MIRNYLLFVIRNFIRNRQSTIINITGLSIAICSAVIISAYILYQFSFDRFHENAGNIYRINTRYGPLNEAVPLGPYLLGEHLEENVPGLISYLRIRPERSDGFWFRYDNRHFQDQDFLLADSNFFTFFSFPLLSGDPSTVLAEPGSLVISESASRMIFGDNDPFGEVVWVQGKFPVTVTGIMADFPSNSHFKASFITSNSMAGNYQPFLLENPGTFGFNYYFLLDENADPADATAGINRALAGVFPDLARIVSFRLQPLLDIRLHSSGIAWDIGEHGNIMLIRGLMAVAIVILLLASVNYINMYTVQATARKKEIGVRRILGARGINIFLYSMAESMLYVLISLILAMCMVEILLPRTANLIEQAPDLSIIFLYPNWIWLLLVMVLLSFLAGFYPAFILGKIRPSEVFRNMGVSRGAGNFSAKILKTRPRLRQLLIIFQFGCAISLIILSLSIDRQIRFMLDVDHGYSDQGLFVIYNPTGEHRESRFYRLRNELESLAAIDHVTSGLNVPSERLNNFTHIRLKDDEHELHTGHINIHDSYFEAIGARLIAGRYFGPDHRTEQNNVIVNRSAASALGKTPEEITGMDLVGFMDNESMHVIGVIEDIHFFSLHELITPMLFTANQGWHTYERILVAAAPGELLNALAMTREIWDREFDDYPLNLAILEEKRMQQYAGEMQTSQFTSLFMVLAIIISLMGLYALASFITTARMKEIALRKVLGAGPLTIMKMILKEFSILVIAGALFAWPVVWVGYNRWLENFAYRQGMDYLVFIAALLTALAAAWVTVSYHTYRAANANPAGVLKRE